MASLKVIASLAAAREAFRSVKGSRPAARSFRHSAASARASARLTFRAPPRGPSMSLRHRARTEIATTPSRPF